MCVCLYNKNKTIYFHSQNVHFVKSNFKCYFGFFSRMLLQCIAYNFTIQSRGNIYTANDIHRILFKKKKNNAHRLKYGINSFDCLTFYANRMEFWCVQSFCHYFNRHCFDSFNIIFFRLMCCIRYINLHISIEYIQ